MKPLSYCYVCGDGLPMKDKKDWITCCLECAEKVDGLAGDRYEPTQWEDLGRVRYNALSPDFHRYRDAMDKLRNACPQCGEKHL